MRVPPRIWGLAHLAQLPNYHLLIIQIMKKCISREYRKWVINCQVIMYIVRHGAQIKIKNRTDK
jgi:hypothetical protein